MAATAIDLLRGILNGFRDLNSKGIYTMNATETDLLRQILLELQALSLGNIPADGSVTTLKIVDLNVTTAKLADSSVTTAKIPDSAVTTSKIPDANITAPKLSGAQTGTAPVSGVRAWVNFNGVPTIAIRASSNISSVTDLGTGTYRVSFTTALPNANYSAVAMASGDGSAATVCYEANSGNNRSSGGTSSIDFQVATLAGSGATRASVNLLVVG